MLPRYAVIGSPIEHSLSPLIHTALAKDMKVPLIYDKILGDDIHFEAQVRDFFASGGQGLNVTLPFKERAFAMADEISVRSIRARASNTLWSQDGGVVIHADNTDGVGWFRDMRRYLWLSKEHDVLLLGAGGAARGLLGALSSFNLRSLTIANRTLENAREIAPIVPDTEAISISALDKHADLPNVIISALSRDAWRTLTLPKRLFERKPFCYDLNYDTQKSTPFVAMAIGHGCEAADGLGMLVEQAAESFWVWHNQRARTVLLDAIESQCVEFVSG